MAQLRTRISPVYVRNPANLVNHGDDPVKLVPLKEERWDKKGNKIEVDVSWFDQLLGGGIDAPDLGEDECNPRSLVVLLSGLPGTGKSTFALELATRLAKEEKKRTLYVSLEEPASSLIQKGVQFGWCGSGQTIVDYEEIAGGAVFPPTGNRGVIVAGSETCAGFKGENDRSSGADLVDGIEMLIDKLGGSVAAQGDDDQKPKPSLDMVVIDSLNLLSPLDSRREIWETYVLVPGATALRDRLRQKETPPSRPDGSEYGADSTAFDALMSENPLDTVVGVTNVGKGPHRPRIVLIVLDTSGDDPVSRYCESVADVVFSFGWESEKGYTLRTFTISKMRSQYHALGKQRLKIFPGPSREIESPYLKEGGIFIFPSIHWHLGRLRSRRPRIASATSSGTDTAGYVRLSDSLNQLNEQLSNDENYQGFPDNGCTAIIGSRGGMKSHFAYHFMLQQAAQGKNVLLISFRDDVVRAKETLDWIAKKQLRLSSDCVTDFIKSDRLEIVQNEPGMVSPEEFFHKFYVAVQRKRVDGNPAKIVVVNGLDQLEARYPLISSEVLFVPSLIELLRSSNTCSLVVSATSDTTSREGPALYGLLPMAELILRFTQIEAHELEEESNNWGRAYRSTFTRKSGRPINQVTAVETVRVPGGQIGGRIGFLHRTPDGSLEYSYSSSQPASAIVP